MSSSELSSSDQQQPPPPTTRSIGSGEWDALSPEAKIKWLLGDSTEKGAFKQRVEERTRRAVAQSDAPDIANRLDWVFVDSDSAALKGASLAQLKRRYTYFVQVDAEGLASGQVNLVRGWEGGVEEDEAAEEDDNDEDWMRIRESMLAPRFYVEMDNDEV
ncbi:hypothetical protein B0T26DRAFT_763723 [Lasiosphaeria miniovina]|uniref:Uncharacterized protein n=1 Tax=Lasiosphaeria miniovina TaxID=1954250 RepID=A0AA40B3A4_9PEZI|nr:uncharacterized protein B0T26DRAFT_763723 [Lasiosphaeria miniovina]KAK0726692.1 hypothetical protein B0T26DRAFT_763723 [Lasiosphaeria miniovina]